MDLNESDLQKTQETLSKSRPDLRTLCLTVDISQDGAMAKALQGMMQHEHFGRLDYAVNCAGINGINANHAPTNSTETSVEYFDKINGINYRGTWMANRAYLDIMMKQEPLPSHDAEMPGREQRGSIVNLSSGLGVIGMPKNRDLMQPTSGDLCPKIAPSTNSRQQPCIALRRLPSLP